MFISSTDYKAHIDTLIQQSDGVDIAVAFWGKGASKYLEASGKRFRILCNLTTGGTNPSEIEELQATYDVRHLDDLHAKVVIGTNLAVVGSANFSTNGLNIESEEFDGWQEAGYVTDKAQDLQAMRGWFERQWQRGAKVTDGDLEQAHANWDRRRQSRIPLTQKRKSILSMPAAELDGRNIFVALWRDEPSPEAESETASWVERMQAGTQTSDKEWGCFEDWEAMKVGQKVISAFVGPKGRILIDGAYEIFRTVQKKRAQAPNRGKLMELQICYKLDKLIDIPFTDADCEQLAKLIRKAGIANELIDAGNPLVPLAAFVGDANASNE